MITYCCSFYQVPAYCMQMMNYHKVQEQERIKFELYMLLIVIEESYNSVEPIIVASLSPRIVFQSFSVVI